MLAALFSSRVRVNLLTAIFSTPGVEWNAWELSQHLRETYSAVWRELNRLEKAGILISSEKGRVKVYQVDPSCPITPELTSIIMKTGGAGGILRKHLAAAGGIQEAFVFGSFATGRADARSDLDLMIIGDVDLQQLAPVISRAEAELNRPINYLIFSVQVWEEKLAGSDPFALNIMDSPRIQLVGGRDAL